ncbi:MAG: WG repeat-containing protein [Oscillospiraceae bacterium]|nr:WG repeat-containing protein [Oscillospiraceae bacterium]
MKHFLSLLLLLCLLLSSCKSPAPVLSEGSTAPETSTSALTEPGLVPDKPTPSPSFVKTDFSQYLPHESSVPLFTRLRENHISDLEASDSYGAIYPFPGSILYNSEENGYSYTAGMLFGFVDATGQIITDPVYTDAQLMIDNLNGTCSDLWTFEKNIKTDPDEDSYWWNSKVYCGFATADGSFVSPCNYRYIRLWGDRVLAFRHTDPYAPAVFDVYDTEGHWIIDSSQFSRHESFDSYGYDFSYSEGLYLICIAEPLPDGDINYSYYYMNEEGKTVLGPYQAAHPFREGKALIQEDSWCLIDHSGNRVSDEYENYIENGAKNYTLYNGESEKKAKCYFVLAPDGKVLLETTEDIVYMDNGAFYYRSSETYPTTDENYLSTEVQSVFYYDAKGTLLWEHSDCIPLNDELIYYDSDSYKISCIENLSTGARLEFPNEETIYCALVGDPKDPIPTYHYSTDSIHYAYRLYTTELKEFPFTEPSQNLRHMVPGSPGQNILSVPVNDEIHIYTGGHELFGTYPFQNIYRGTTYWDSTVILTDKSCTRMYSQDGTMIFCYPLLSSVED